MELSIDLYHRRHGKTKSNGKTCAKGQTSGCLSGHAYSWAIPFALSVGLYAGKVALSLVEGIDDFKLHSSNLSLDKSKYCHNQKR